MIKTDLLSTWNTFDSVREHLFRQFENPPYDPSSGLAPDELEREVEAYLAAHAGTPRVLQKAHISALILTRGQICVDPQDWFADKLNHADLIRKIDERWLSEAQAGPLREESGWFRMLWERGVGRGLLDTGHISPGWENMFSGGLNGLIAQARAALAQLGAAGHPGAARLLRCGRAGLPGCRNARPAVRGAGPPDRDSTARSRRAHAGAGGGLRARAGRVAANALRGAAVCLADAPADRDGRGNGALDGPFRPAVPALLHRRPRRGPPDARPGQRTDPVFLVQILRSHPGLRQRQELRLRRAVRRWAGSDQRADLPGAGSLRRAQHARSQAVGALLYPPPRTGCTGGWPI